MLNSHTGWFRASNLWVQNCNIFSRGLRQCLHFSRFPFENILLIASLMLECFFTNLLLMHVKLTPTAIGVARRKSPKGERGSVSHEGPWAIWTLLYFIVASEGELIQCCTQNFPYAEGELIKCGTKSRHTGPCELRREPIECLKLRELKTKLLAYRTSFTIALILIWDKDEM